MPEGSSSAWKQKSPEQKKSLVRELVAPNKIADIACEKFIAQADANDLDPLLGQIFLIPKGGSYIAVTHYAQYIRRARNSGKLASYDANSISEVMYRDQKPTLAATCTIRRTDTDDLFVWTVYEREAAASTVGWSKMPYFMLRKTAISQAFRLCFPEETADLPYAEEEIASDPAASRIGEAIGARRSITDAVESLRLHPRANNDK